jgi:hypothetical protein
MSLREIFQDVYTNWRFGGWPESKSGGGSTLDETEGIRQQIKQLVKDKEIKSVVDIPCGDFNWMKDIVYSFESYTGCDIVPELIQDNQKYANSIIKFQELDLTQNDIPEADLLIVRDVIGHLTLEDGKKVIQNILKSKCKYLLTTTWYNVNDENYHLTHNNTDNTVTLDAQWERGAAAFYPVCLHSEPFNLPKPTLYIEEKTKVDNYDNGVRKGLAFYELDNLRSKFTLTPVAKQETTDDLTLVTGLWNVNRPGRDFSHYIENFKKFLDIPVKMFIYIPAEYEYLVWEKRSRENTHVRIFELDDIRNNLYQPFWDKTQEIRTSTEWLDQTGEHGWLKNSPQAAIEWYNPIVQSKMFMLHDAKVLNVFDTNYFLWLDAGITNTVYEKYFTEHRCLDKILPYLKTFLFLSYPYEANTEIHGFNFKAINRYAREEVKYVCRGGLFGGHKDFLSEANSTYYALLQGTLNERYMGTEESIFSIMAHLEPHIYRRFALDDNGLIVKFVQALLDDTVVLEQNSKRAHVLPKGTYNETTDKTSLYMLTFNFPEQIEHTLATWEANSPDWLSKPRKILIDNSTSEDARVRNKEVADKWGFEHIIMNENKGINGGRLFAAKHFHESDSDYYFFFEDDMGFYPATETGFCRNGCKKHIPDLYKKVHEIMAKEEFDFLKLSYTEVYMDNNIQVSWYNVPQSIRTYMWPDYDQLPVSGLDPYAPRTKFDRIEVHKELSYITGEIYYANWPMIVNKKGNYKMFLETEWANPFEQTWMSYMFQETVRGHIKPAILLAAPVWHNRIIYYKPEERREN